MSSFSNIKYFLYAFIYKYIFRLEKLQVKNYFLKNYIAKIL